MIRSRLYLQIYLTVLASLALIAMLLGLLAFFGNFDPRGPMEDRATLFFQTVFTDLPEGAARQAMLDRISRAAQADIAIFDRYGHLIAGAGNPIESPDAMPPPDGGPLHLRPFHTVLADGSRVVAYVQDPFMPPRRHLILTILVIAGLIAIAAYPAVRHLTRRLESVRAGMENWGDGDLSARISIGGEDEIAAVAKAFNHAAERVERLVNTQKAFAANASHELRSPLARLRMAIEMQVTHPSPAIRDEMVRNLAELDDLVEEILLKSRIGSHQPIVLDQEVELLTLAAEEAAVIGAEAGGDIVTIDGNEKLIRRMLRNLLMNAARHGKPPVTINVTSSAGTVTIDIEDCGEGIDPDEAGRIFEPFYRPKGRSESDGGWGLGLALVSEIADLHGGRVSYHQTSFGKACFRVEIPRKSKGYEKGTKPA